MNHVYLSTYIYANFPGTGLHRHELGIQMPAMETFANKFYTLHNVNVSYIENKSNIYTVHEQQRQ